MTTGWYGDLASRLPLAITRAEYDGTTLLIAGPEWSFATISAWRVSLNGVLRYGWSAPEAPAEIAKLVGGQLISMQHQSSIIAADPAFELSTGEWLEVFADHGADPWILELRRSATA